ncbi:hypothetical protein DM806_05000 [Sphingobium lactosutens]|uniref:hypothetical protein n=1 Tax=Sphingobium lactosutens TaxID=522773 RepID=UPI0015BDB6CF|nr:hypothetical protein [Sphingobium lactosutens]NWK95033.1 hypothetical protein [Sphingobium lactosutens]
MADIVLHPAAREKLQARLAEVEAILAQIDGGLLHLLADPQYRASTAVNARREGVSVEEMHRRGSAGARQHFEAEAAGIRKTLS